MNLTAFHRALALALIAVGAGCATTDPSVIGSKPWYEQRMTEIESAHDRGELTEEEYLRLKNEADAIRADYRGARGPTSGVSVGVGFISHD